MIIRILFAISVSISLVSTYVRAEPIGATASKGINAYKRYGRPYLGTSLGAQALSSQKHQEILKDNYSFLVIENDLKMNNIHPTNRVDVVQMRGENLESFWQRYYIAQSNAGFSDYRFGNLTRVLDFARDNKLKVRGHTLVYHRNVPSWMARLSKAQSISAIGKHCYTIVRYLKEHYPMGDSQPWGRIRQWDVINEHLSVMEDTPPWVGRKLNGEVDLYNIDYWFAAFNAAHFADPIAELFYKDYNLEGIYG